MKWSLHSYFLSQTSNDEVWGKFALVVAYLSSTLISNFWPSKNIEIPIISLTSASRSVDASENDRGWKNTTKKVKAEDLLILVSTQTYPESLDLLKFCIPFPRYTLLRKTDYWQRTCFDPKWPSWVLVKSWRTWLSESEIRKLVILADFFYSASLWCLGRTLGSLALWDTGHFSLQALRGDPGWPLQLLPSIAMSVCWLAYLVILTSLRAWAKCTQSGRQSDLKYLYLR